MMGRKVPLNMYGPTALEEMLETHRRFFGPLPYKLQYHLSKDGKIIYEDAKNEVIAFKLMHRIETYGYLFKEKPALLNIDKIKIGQYKLGVEDIKKIKEGKDHITEEGAIIPNKALTLPAIKQRSYAYLSDTVYMKNIAEKIHGVDLMFHEATFLERDLNLAKQTFHSTAKQAAMVAKEAKAGKLLIGHFSTRYKDVNLFVNEARTVFSDTVAINDGDRFVVEQTREVL
jgi:ribonuclease Z